MDTSAYRTLFSPTPGRVATLFFTLSLIVALWVVRDYGVNWDDTTQRTEVGLVFWNYLFHSDEALFANRHRIYGPAFEIFLIAVEKGLGLQEFRQIFLMRHFLTFFTFWIGCILFFRLLLLRCSS
ncbi:MAG: hypothetical protein EBZ48_04600, partial [Proteobacteria bacterium]|nr:hypothetical protein [Pseudomonadota bacterium]